MNIRAFSMIMVTLLVPVSEERSGPRATFELAFDIFDTDGRGFLNRRKFDVMLSVLYVTHESALRLIFENGAGRDMLRAFAVRSRS
jgi:hypothetical protein